MTDETASSPSPSPIAPSLVDRELMARDLARLAGLLTAILASRLEVLRGWRPRVGLL